jgi:hypothetical protein
VVVVASPNDALQQLELPVALQQLQLKRFVTFHQQ